MDQSVKLYGDGVGEVRLIEYVGSDKSVVNSARVSFMSDKPGESGLSDKDNKLLKYLADNKHTSTFEHCSMTFRITVPLFVARQHMRHRTWSYNEASRRYTSYNINFYCPEDFRRQAETNRQASVADGKCINPIVSTVIGTSTDYSKKANEAVLSHSRKSLKLYEQLLAKGVCREQARMVLPQNMYTEYWATANLLNIMKFLKLRVAKDSQVEMQDMAKAVASFVKDIFPESYKAWAIDSH
jgi:thymidylate synthase (FAD)